MLSPTESELLILQELWSGGPQTVRQVNERLNASGDKTIGYTTTLKLMQLMAEKGLVTRDMSSRSHVYAAAIAQEPTQRHMIGRFIDRAFGGSRSELVLRALGDGDATPGELEEIKRLIEQLEKDNDHA